MLDCNDQSQGAEALSKKLTCEINLPDRWKEDWTRQGPLPTRSDERRRFPRFHFRAAILKCKQTFRALSRKPATHLIYTTNLSRGGMAFLHSEELFPQEQVQIGLRGAQPLDLEVIHCRYIDERCYVVGGRFLEELDAAIVQALVPQRR